MKKILSLVLALIMCLTVMTSCEMLESLLNPQPEVPVVTDAELAIQTLTTKYYGKNDGVSRDYDLDRAVVGGNTKFAVQWSVDLETIQIVEKDERNVTVDLPADNAEETTYVLTAKIVDADGKEYTKSFTLTLPKYTSDPKADSALTIAEAIALGNKKAHNEYTAGKYYVTGTIKEVYQTKYGNMYLEDAEGNVLTVYGTYSADGSTQYGSMETKPVAGDVITVYGIIGKYNTTPQMKNGWITAHTPAGEEVPTYTQVTDLTTLKTGDKVVIGNPAHGKLLSMTKTGYYNVGVDYNEEGFQNVTDDEIFVVTVNADGTYEFVSVSGKVLAMAASNSSLNVDGEHKTWTITTVEGKTGLFYINNVGRSKTIEWYAAKDNWSTYTGTGDLFELALYTVPAGSGSGSQTPVEPAHECESVCAACGKCTDTACTEDVCKNNQCAGHITSVTGTVTFNLGANGDAKHVDGNDLGAKAIFTEGDSVLVLEGMSKVYGPAYDAKGNSCIKLGTSKVEGTLTFTVGENVTSVVVMVARYKNYDNSKITVNGGAEITLETNSNDGQYYELVIDTTTTKTVTISTVAGNLRVMINSITLVCGQ